MGNGKYIGNTLAIALLHDQSWTIPSGLIVLPVNLKQIRGGHLVRFPCDPKSQSTPFTKMEASISVF